MERRQARIKTIRGNFETIFPDVNWKNNDTRILVARSRLILHMTRMNRESMCKGAIMIPDCVSCLASPKDPIGGCTFHLEYEN